MSVLRCAITLLALGTAAPVFAEPLALRIEREPDPRLAQAPGKTPTFGAANKATGSLGESILLEGEARLRQGATSIAGERIEYAADNDTLRAEGQVRVVREGRVVEGSRLHLQVEAQIGAMEQASFTLPTFGASGSAQRIEFDGPGRMRLLGAMFTTCRPEQADWLLMSDKVTLDETAEWGKAESASMQFRGLSIPPIPSVSFPLSDKRRSGWLSPSFGLTTRTGFELSAPYYLELAPERDLTLYPRVSVLQGVYLGAWARYIDHAYQGDAKLDINPRDLQTGDLRYQWSTQHRFQNWSGWSGQWDFRGVSDDRYLVDYSRTILGSSVRSLPRVVSASRSIELPWLGAASLTLLSASYQNVLDARNSPPYEVLPRLTVQWNRFGQESAHMDGLYLDAAALAEVTRFRRPLVESLEGFRSVVQPSVQATWRRPWGYLSPGAAVHVTDYRFVASEVLAQSSLPPEAIAERAAQRAVPRFSLDSGLFLQRTRSEEKLEQTLEPRVYYLYVPYRDQRQLPIYDTAVADLSYAQLFAENRFVGNDRIADANQVTFALTSRFLRPDTGREFLRIAGAVRQHITSPRLQIIGQALPGDPRSDLVVAASGQPSAAWRFDAGLQVGLSSYDLTRFTVGGRYQPDESRLINAGVRFIASQVGQVDASWRWPLSKGWSLLGRTNYSFQRSILDPVSLRLTPSAPGFIEALLGAERREDCWTLRAVMQRFVTGPDLFNTAVFVQLELNGLGSIGNSPFDILRRNIPGYVRTRERPPDAPFFAYE